MSEAYAGFCVGVFVGTVMATAIALWSHSRIEQTTKEVWLIVGKESAIFEECTEAFLRRDWPAHTRLAAKHEALARQINKLDA